MVDNFVIGFGIGLLALLLWRCLKERHWSHYALFFSYLAYIFLQSLILFPFWKLGHPAYGLIYWYSDLGAVLLRFCVAWEVFRQIFMPGAPLRKIAGLAIGVLLLVLAAAFYFLSSEPGSFFLDLERKAGLAVVAWLVVVLLLARYYNVRVSANIWGMAVGMGLFVSVSIANFAAFDLLNSFLPFWRLISPFSFLAMLLIWTWTLWFYAPEPQPQSYNELLLQAALVRWKRSWSHLGPSIRKAIGL